MHRLADAFHTSHMYIYWRCWNVFLLSVFVCVCFLFCFLLFTFCVASRKNEINGQRGLTISFIKTSFPSAKRGESKRNHSPLSAHSALHKHKILFYVYALSNIFSLFLESIHVFVFWVHTCLSMRCVVYLRYLGGRLYSYVDCGVWIKIYSSHSICFFSFTFGVLEMAILSFSLSYCFR